MWLQTRHSMPMSMQANNTAVATMSIWPVPQWALMDRMQDTADTLTEHARWASQACAGHSQAFERLVEAYSTRIFTHLYRLVRSREDAEDLTQETFIRAFRFIHQYDGQRPFRNWLYTIATNVGLNAIRSRQRRGKFEVNPGADDTALAAAQSSADPQRDAVRVELRERLADAIDTLSPEVSMLMHLFYFEGMSVEEAAEIVGMSESATKVALHRARKRLREQLVDLDNE